MKPSGSGIFQTSKDLNRNVTFEDNSITNKTERAKIFGHYNNVRVYELDYFEKLRNISFEVEKVDCNA